MQLLPLAVHDDRAEHEIARRAGCGAARSGDAGGDAAAEGGQRSEVRRLEGEHLVVIGECGFDFQQGRARTRGDNQFRRIVRDDAAISARVEDVTFQRLTVPVFGAAATDAQRAPLGAGRTHAFRPYGDDVVLFHGVPLRCVSFDCTGRGLAGNQERTRIG